MKEMAEETKTSQHAPGVENLKVCSTSSNREEDQEFQGAPWLNVLPLVLIWQRRWLSLARRQRDMNVSP